MFTNHWQRQVVFSPFSTLLVSSPRLPRIPSFSFHEINQIRVYALVKWQGSGWVVCTYPIRIQGRPHTHTYYILSAIACMYTPSRAIFFPQTTLELLPWQRTHTIATLLFVFPYTSIVCMYGFLIVSCERNNLILVRRKPRKWRESRSFSTLKICRVGQEQTFGSRPRAKKKK